MNCSSCMATGAKMTALEERVRAIGKIIEEAGLPLDEKHQDLIARLAVLHGFSYGAAQHEIGHIMARLPGVEEGPAHGLNMPGATRG